MAKCPYCEVACGNSYCAYADKEEEVKTISEKLREYEATLPPPEEPAYVYTKGPTLIFFFTKFKFELDICETEPYAPDGDAPFIFVRIGWVEFMFESKTLYKLIYKRRHGYEPWGLEKK